MSNTIIPIVVLQEVMDAMDDMATDSRLLDMKQSRVHQFDAARDALRAALDNLQCGCEQNLNMIPAGWKLVPVELLERVINSLGSFVGDHGWAQSDMDNMDSLSAMLAAAPQPPATVNMQPDPAPYLWYDPENGDTWTQEAIDEGFCATDGLIPLYDNQSNTKEKK